MRRVLFTFFANRPCCLRWRIASVGSNCIVRLDNSHDIPFPFAIYLPSTYRTQFYKAILLALLSRSILLPMETYLSTRKDTSPYPPSESPLLRCLYRICQTLPDVAFASALATIVIFCAKTAFSAMPPLTPEQSESSMHGGDDAETMEDGETERAGPSSGRERGTMKSRTNFDDAEDGAECAIGNSKATSRGGACCCRCISAARLSRSVLASRRTFFAWNAILIASYALVFVADVAVSRVPHVICEISLWIVMATMYSFLLISLCYAATLLMVALYSGIVRRENADSLAMRLVGSCTFLALMFIDRVVRFGTAAARAIAHMESDRQDESIVHMSYGRNTIDYAISESLPVLFILFMMHRKTKVVQSDVLIMHTFHSIRNNLFGSTSRLGVAETPHFDSTAIVASTSADGADTIARAAGLGTRQFQTYGGTKVDSFPTSGNQPSRNIPRAISAGAASRPKQ